MDSSSSALVEQLAGLVLSVDADEPGLTLLATALTELHQRLGDREREPVARALASVDDLKGIAPREALKAVSEAISALQSIAPDAPGAPRRVSRDVETLELMRDFLQESGDGIATADELLLNVESSGATSEKVNGLFRVFHSIKGVAGFLELTEIVALSHATESLMNEVREGRCPLSGHALELVFKATGVLRVMLGQLKQDCEAGVALVSNPAALVLVARLQAFLTSREQELEPEADAELGGQGSATLVDPETRSGGVAPKAYAATKRSGDALEPKRPEAQPDFTPLPSESAPAPVSKMRETVKVDLERVDSMVEMIGELIIVESMLKHSKESAPMRETLNQLGKISRELQGAAMRMRTVPVHATFQKMARLTREVGRKAGKEVALVMHGEGTEMDRAMVERLEDPLVHMVRNAIDHGLESPAERLAAGKPAAGVLTLSARHQGGSIVIELSDDGRGLDRARIVKKAIERGLVAQATSLSEQDVFQLIFAPGFSTAAKVTEVSGRGVGMDVVKRNIEAMRGRVLIESSPGKGSTFRLVLPLTLAIIDGMLITVGRERYLVPSLSIVEALQPTRAMVSSVGASRELLTVRGQVLPLLRLASLLGVDGARGEPTSALVVVIESMGKRVGLLVDQVLAQQQVVIKALGQGVGKAEFYSGAAILSDGNVGLILDVDALCGLVTYRHRPTIAQQSEARP